MNIKEIKIEQLEGYTNELTKTAHDKWDDAIVTLRKICYKKEMYSPEGFWKTAVKVSFDDDSWIRYRFDACFDSIDDLNAFETFSKNTLISACSEFERE
jgi:hypothetical protein